MNVTVENLAPCKKLLRVEVDAQTVDTTFDSITKEFVKQVQLPGFRPGKAPKDMVAKNFSSKIEEEVKRKLVSDSYGKALEQEKLKVVTQPDIEEIQFGRGQALQFAATVETEPDFELPEYKGLDVKRENAVVTEADLTRALGVLQEQRATYNDVTREVKDGDFVVVNYTGTCDGKPITETAPTARGLTEQKNFWMHVQKDSFIPGFTEQLIGAKTGDKRTVNVDFPQDFVAAALSGKKGVYEVEIAQVKERAMPAIDEEFAKSFGAENLEALREGVKTDLDRELKFKQTRDVRDQLLKSLLGKVTFELPESVVSAETRSAVYDLVRENQQRGVAREIIESKKDEIYTAANANAKDRVKILFLLNRIAQKENIKVEQQEIAQRVMYMAQESQTKPEKLIKELRERNGFAEIHEQILMGKVLDFLQLNAKIEEVPAASAS